MYTIAATDNTHRDDRMEWAALRDRPKPVFTRVSPTHAIGTMKTRKRAQKRRGIGEGSKRLSGHPFSVFRAE